MDLLSEGVWEVLDICKGGIEGYVVVGVVFGVGFINLFVR